MTDEELFKTALEARNDTYAPYSHWTVGAALLAADGTVYKGCNIENAAFTPTNCAERTAFFKAVSEGKREFSAIAIAGGRKDEESGEICAPCSVCRQVLMEFCNPKTFRILLGTSKGVERVQTLEELLPCGFGPQMLQEKDQG